MIINVEITLDDRDWPNLKLIVKEGTLVQTETALKDVAGSKFQAIINNFVNRAVGRISDRRKQNV